MRSGEFRKGHFDLIDHLHPQEFEFRDGHKYFYSSNGYLVPENNFGELKKILYHMSCDIYEPRDNKKDDALTPLKIHHDSKSRFCKIGHGAESVNWIHAGIHEEKGGVVFYSIGDDLFDVTTNITINPKKQQKILNEYLTRFQKAIKNKCNEGFLLPDKVYWDSGFITLKREKGFLDHQITHLYDFMNFLQEFAKELDPEKRAGWYREEYNFRICSKHKEDLPDIEKDHKLSVINHFGERGFTLEDERDITVKFRENPIFRVDGNLVNF